MKIYLAAALLIALNIGWIDSFAQVQISKSEFQTAERNSDSVNIQTIVAGRVEAAKEKQNSKLSVPVSKNENSAKKNSVNKNPEEKISSEQNLQSEISTASILNNIYFKIFILVDLLLAAILFIGWKRRKMKVEQEVKSRFKKNIKKLREEKIKVRHDERMGQIRKSLQKHPIVTDINEIEITKQAKELSISKGEIYLAAKLQAINKE